MAEEALPTKAKDVRSIELDCVRGVAILLAMGWHFNGRSTGYFFIDVLLLPGRSFGWAGVDLFFVLSGFLVGGLIFSEYRSTGGFQARRFLIRRAFKIWPVLYAYIALLVVTGRYPPSAIVPQTLFHVQNYFLTPLNHLWSLAVEEHFYTAFALLSFLYLRRRHGPKTIPYFLIGILVGVLTIRIAAALSDVALAKLQGQTQYRIDSLASGVLLAYLREFHGPLFEDLARKKAILTCIVAAGVAFLILQPRGIISTTLGFTFNYIAGGAFVLLAYRLPQLSHRNIAARALAWIGTYSYAMYVFQFVPFRVAEAVWARISPTAMPALLELFVRYAGAISLAVIVTKILERPTLALRDRWFPSSIRIPHGGNTIVPTANTS